MSTKNSVVSGTQPRRSGRKRRQSGELNDVQEAMRKKTPEEDAALCTRLFDERAEARETYLRKELRRARREIALLKRTEPIALPDEVHSDDGATVSELFDQLAKAADTLSADDDDETEQPKWTVMEVERLLHKAQRSDNSMKVAIGVPLGGWKWLRDNALPFLASVTYDGSRRANKARKQRMSDELQMFMTLWWARQVSCERVCVSILIAPNFTCSAHHARAHSTRRLQHWHSSCRCPSAM